jgi:hypothetical protein
MSAETPRRSILPEPRIPVRVVYQLAEAVEREGGNVDDLRSLLAEWEHLRAVSRRAKPYSHDDGQRPKRRGCERRRLRSYGVTGITGTYRVHGCDGLVDRWLGG